MEIKQLGYLIEVAKREHISEIALELNITQSAISRQIILLEQELNVSLLKKQGHNITLTSEGKLLFNEALRIIEHLDSTIEQLQNHGLTKNKSIYIGYDESNVSRMLLPLIQAFHLQNDTHVIPSLLEHGTIINSVLNRSINIGFTEPTPEVHKRKQLHTLPLFEEYYRLYAPSDDPIAMAVRPPLIQFEHSYVHCLAPFAEIVRKQLHKITKSDTYTISSQPLMQYLLRQKEDYIISSQNIHLLESESQIDIKLDHIELRRTIRAITRESYTKGDISVLLILIQQLMTKTSTFHQVIRCY